MFQRMRSFLPIDIPGEDMAAMSGIEVCLEQESSGQEFVYSGDSVTAAGSRVVVEIPKADADRLDYGEACCQVMFTRPTGVPDATEKVKFKVYELLKDGGYGD